MVTIISRKQKERGTISHSGTSSLYSSRNEQNMGKKKWIKFFVFKSWSSFVFISYYSRLNRGRGRCCLRTIDGSINFLIHHTRGNFGMRRLKACANKQVTSAEWCMSKSNAHDVFGDATCIYNNATIRNFSSVCDCTTNHNQATSFSCTKFFLINWRVICRPRMMKRR